MSWLFRRPPSNTEFFTVTSSARTHRFAPLVNRMFWMVAFGVVTVTSWLTTVSGTDSLAPVLLALGKFEMGAGGDVGDGIGWQAAARTVATMGSAIRIRAPRAGVRVVRKRDTGILLGGWAGPLVATAPAAGGTSDGVRHHRGGPGWGEVPRGARARVGRGQARHGGDGGGGQPVSGCALGGSPGPAHRVHGGGGAGRPGRPGGL